MMLKNDFYKIIDSESGTEMLNCTIGINEAHAIFEGHFPGQPVVPGACWLQIVKELLESAIDKKLQMTRADELKFLSPVDPRRNNTLTVKIQYKTGEDISAAASIHAGEITCFKSRMLFRIDDAIV